MAVMAVVLDYAQVAAWEIVKILVQQLVRMIAKVLVKLAVLHALVLVLAAALAVRVVAKVLVLEAVKIAVSKSVNQVAMTLVWAAKVLMQARVALIANAGIIQGDLYVSRWICCTQGIFSKS